MKRGFTLIEFLVIAAIIAVTAGFIYANVQLSGEKSRDTVRISDMKDLQVNLALYKSNKGQFPVYEGFITGADSFSQTLMGETGMKRIPIDPVNAISGNVEYKYYYKSNGAGYRINFCLETSSVLGYNKGCGNEIKQ